MQPLRDNARILAAAMVGTAVEYYDFFIYATAAALVFGPLFFPSESATAQTLLAFMSFGIAFIARPIGGVVFGHFGDRIGRKSTLVVSLMLMGGSTLAIAFLPTYQMVGWVAPVLLYVMRFGQGFGLGGEWGGAALLAVENAPKGWEARFGAAPQSGVPIGFFAANGLFLAIGFWLSDAEFAAWGWRIPFAASSVLVALRLWMRHKIGETPQFRAALEREPPVPVPLAQVLRHHWGAVLAGSAGVVVVFATFYLGTAWALAELTGAQHQPREAVLGIQLIANLTLTAGIFLAAWIADRTRPATAISIGSLGVVVMGIAFGPGLASGSLALAGLTLCVTMFFMGMTNGPLGSWLISLFPVRLRYSGVSFAFNFGGILGGAVTPILAQLLSGAGGGVYTGLLLSGAAVLSLLGLQLARPQTTGE
ncbi:MFS transporter [Novosphingobium sp. G106]|uniref:MFS transporter n=1 Tax=Novosphingobium sp. G106 TaxID=2849500 RepID=UPI001C2D6994|nr:MFS transporter [Novosphingobium sp. G106]MBV1691767.1 MFS transporter [Novosphingobium sp. G106]